MRVDANVSVNRAGEPWGTRCEIKNLNSLRSLGRAIDHEALRQIDLLDGGERVRQETRHWDEAAGRTGTLRVKEDADDYRYFPEPDLVPLEPERRRHRPHRRRAARRCPPLAAPRWPPPPGARPRRRRSRSRSNADLDGLAVGRHRRRRRRRPGAHPRRAQPRRRGRRVAVGRAPRRAREDGDRRRAHRHPGQDRAGRGRGHRVVARRRSPKAHGFEALDTGALEAIVDAVIAAHPDEWAQLRAGDDKAQGKLAGFFMGKVMQASKGQADGKAATALLRAKAGL